MKTLVCLIAVLAGCGPAYPENTPFEYDIDGVVFKSAVKLSADFARCDIQSARAQFSTVAPVEGFDAALQRVTVWVRDDADHFNSDGGDVSGEFIPTVGGRGDIILPSKMRFLSHEMFHAWIVLVKKDFRPGHIDWEKNGYLDAVKRTTAKLYNCPDNPWVEWFPPMN